MARKGLGFFLAELRRRKVASVAAAYAVVAWGVIEVSSTVLQMAAAPPWVAKVVLATVALAFPLVLVLAWIFDLSPSGVVRTEALEGSDSVAVARTARRALAAVVVLTVAVSSAFALWLRGPDAPTVTYTQLTNFADAATAPALSPDGSKLVFLKGSGYFGNSAARADVFIKQLPDGEAVQLTRSANGKATPRFFPDGARVAFTYAEQSFDWHTHAISVHGGNDVELLPNASGMDWIDSANVVYSEVRSGVYMGIRRSSLQRDNAQDVYWPSTEDGNSMAHRTWVSPDKQRALIAEMVNGIWTPCRLVPLDGSTRGEPVGPSGPCTYAAWSPDGRWMYFSSSASGTFHLWRQRYPKGKPEQLTNGPMEEEGIAVAPDGRSLITSAGVRLNTIGLVGGSAISVEEYAFEPVATRDGKRVYYLARSKASGYGYHVGHLAALTLESGAREDVLPGHVITHIALSADDKRILFVSASAEAQQRGLWIAALDHSTPPRRIYSGVTARAFFDAGDNVFFLAEHGDALHVHRLSAPDYAVSEPVYEKDTHYLFGISADGEWLAAVSPERQGLRQIAISTRGLPARLLCDFCGGGAGPARILAPAISWTRDGAAMLVSSQFARHPGMAGSGNTIIVPVRPGAAIPPLPEGGIRAADDYLRLPGARVVSETNVLPGASPEQLFYYDARTIRNLYRVTLPR